MITNLKRKGRIRNMKKILTKKSTRTFLVIAFCLMMSVAAVGATSRTVHANAGKAAAKFLKGKWYCNSIHGDFGKPNYYVKFTKKYEKSYFLNPNTGKYEYTGKSRIVSAKKSGTGYLIKLRDNGGYKFCYKTSDDDKNLLEYYGTWKFSEFGSTYSGSSSLFRK